MGTDTLSLTWRINNTYRGTYRYLGDDPFPQTLSLSPFLPDVNIMITSASFSGSDSRIESTLNANVSSLRETLIECSSFVANSRIANSTIVQERQGIV